ncbi:Crp/Fnr family transcriptional regulator, partial [Fusobacterium nucleatum]|uniref:Crp/Fnr family transcriptional regulator n=2 Tax=Fusobacteriaceae TaxID=203492 RepID=UPI001F5211C1
MKTNESDIKRIEVFKGISKNSIKEIKNNSDTIELKKNKALYSDRQVLNYIYFLISGNVSLIKSNENGESKVIFLLGSGSMINEPLMRKNTSGIECWGFENSKILRINLKVFDKIMENDYILAKNCMFFMERRIRRLYRQLKNSTSASIEKKLTAKLYRLGTQYGINDNQIEKFILINLNLTVTYIAKMLGHQRETISRAIKIL